MTLSCIAELMSGSLRMRNLNDTHHRCLTNHRHHSTGLHWRQERGAQAMSIYKYSKLELCETRVIFRAREYYRGFRIPVREHRHLMAYAKLMAERWERLERTWTRQ
jgi:hypothetical protein